MNHTTTPFSRKCHLLISSSHYNPNNNSDAQDENSPPKARFLCRGDRRTYHCRHRRIRMGTVPFLFCILVWITVVHVHDSLQRILQPQYQNIVTNTATSIVWNPNHHPDQPIGGITTPSTARENDDDDSNNDDDHDDNTTMAPTLPLKRLLIAQYAAAAATESEYDTILRITGRVNRAYASYWGHDYVLLRGLPFARRYPPASSSKNHPATTSVVSHFTVEWFVAEKGWREAHEMAYYAVIKTNNSTTATKNSNPQSLLGNMEYRYQRILPPPSTHNESSGFSFSDDPTVPASRSTYNKVALLELALFNHTTNIVDDDANIHSSNCTVDDGDKDWDEDPFHVYDRLLILDADAMMYDFSQNIATLLPEDDELVLVAHKNHADDPEATGSINIGVSLWNLRNPYTPYIVQRWRQKCWDRIRNQRNDDDQAPLQEIIKYDLDDKRREQVVLALSEEFRFGKGTFVKHFFRAPHQPNNINQTTASLDSWNPLSYVKTSTQAESSGQQRIAKIQATAREVCERYQVCEEEEGEDDTTPP